MNDRLQDAPAVSTPLRTGVILDGGALREWQARCLSELLSRPGASLELVVVFPNTAGNHCGASTPASQKFVAPENVFPGVPRLSCAPKQGHSTAYGLADSEVADIRRRELDVLVYFGNRPLRGDVLTAAKHGVWMYEFGDPELYPSGTAGIWELISGDPVAAARLVRLGDSEHGVMLRRGSFPVTADSLPETVDRAGFGVAMWLRQAACDLDNGLAAALDDPAHKVKLRERHDPGGSAWLGMAARIAWAKLVRRASTLLRCEEWNTGVVRRPIESFLSAPEIEHVDWLDRPARGTFLADPFGIEDGGRRYVFAEHYDYEDQCGMLVCGELGTKGGEQPADGLRPMLAADGCHRSYPFIIQYGDEVYCLPETRALRELALYRAVKLPDRWEKAAVLLSDVDAIDPSVVRYGGRWWLFFVSKDPEHNTELLNIYHAPEPAGPWEPHANNPVKIDVETARPGGTPFVHEGRLYRPAQDCGTTYGRRVVINRVTKLSEAEFSEEVAAVVEPQRGPGYSAGLHTLSAVGDWTLIDGKRWVFVPAVFRRKMAALWRKLLRIKAKTG